MHVSNDVSVANLITWALALLGFAYACGILVNKLEEVRLDVASLLGQFKDHIEDDRRWFEALQAQIVELIARPRP